MHNASFLSLNKVIFFSFLHQSQLCLLCFHPFNTSSAHSEAYLHLAHIHAKHPVSPHNKCSADSCADNCRRRCPVNLKESVRLSIVFHGAPDKKQLQ